MSVCTRGIGRCCRACSVIDNGDSNSVFSVPRADRTVSVAAAAACRRELSFAALLFLFAVVFVIHVHVLAALGPEHFAEQINNEPQTDAQPAQNAQQ